MRRPRLRGGHPPRGGRSESAGESSPPTRGSSPRQRREQSEQEVVPAYAGVIPRRRPRPQTTARRPRLRGGHPPIPWRSRWWTSSSPPTRGSSLRAVGRARDAGVVPAYAGVIPPRAPSATKRGRRPRLRGGHPARGADRPAARRSSPPTRGSSALPLLRRGTLEVVPAYAGVIPRRSCTPGEHTRRPRLRGGHPPVLALTNYAWSSSPPTRGSSPRPEQLGRHDPVVPAYAGVIRCGTSGLRSLGRRPRLRGGHPLELSIDWASLSSSPPTRGSSPPDPVHQPLDGVVPAYAGVIPDDLLDAGRRRGRPRLRGGHPASAACQAMSQGSSPPTRGSSSRAPALGARAPVVPAYAGVIPHVHQREHLPRGRPRLRGGHPQMNLIFRLASESSPPTRGSSLPPLGGVGLVLVVPAYAGVIPPRCAPSGRSPGRPRLRGGHPVWSGPRSP